MNFVDMIKDSVVAEFTGTISVDKILISLLTTFLISIYIIYIYKKTYTGVVYSKAFSLCLILISMVTTLIIRTISSNLALSLGMVGALSIVRFRTAIKEPVDTAFMFWAITAGIMSGAGLYLVSIVASLCVGLFYFVSYIFGFKTSKQFLLVVKYDISEEDKVLNKISSIEKTKLKSKTVTGSIVEVAYEIEIKEKQEKILDKFKNNEKIKSASIISYQNDFGL